MNSAIEIDMSGLGLDEALIHYVRRCCTRLEESLGRRCRWSVALASIPERESIEVSVTGYLGGSEPRRARARELDGMLAVRNAFARLEAGLGALVCAGPAEREI